MPTSKLQRQIKARLREYLPYCDIQENIRPPWLECDGRRLELDLYVPIADIAIEVQGLQHYRYCSAFHRTLEDFEDQLKRDALKKARCAELNIDFYELHGVVDVDEHIDTMLKRIREKDSAYAKLQWRAAQWRYVSARTVKFKTPLFDILKRERHVQYLVRIGHKKIAAKDLQRVREKCAAREEQLQILFDTLHYKERRLRAVFRADYGPEPK